MRHERRIALEIEHEVEQIGPAVMNPPDHRDVRRGAAAALRMRRRACPGAATPPA
jgi:hypothetical protein